MDHPLRHGMRLRHWCETELFAGERALIVKRVEVPGSCWLLDE